MMGPNAERARRRLALIGRVRENPPVAAVLAAENATRDEVLARGSGWSDFLSVLNTAMSSYRREIEKAMAAEDLDAVVESMADAFEDITEDLAEKFGYDLDAEDDGEGDPGDEQFEGGEDDEENATDDGPTVLE